MNALLLHLPLYTARCDAYYDFSKTAPLSANFLCSE